MLKEFADYQGKISLRNQKNFSEAALHYRQTITMKHSSIKNRSPNQTLDLFELNYDEQSSERVTLNCSTQGDSIYYELTLAKNLQISKSSASGDHNRNNFDDSDILDASWLPKQEEISRMYLQQALSLQSRKKWFLAREFCRQALVMNPNSIEAEQLWNSMLQQRTKLLESQETSATLPSQSLSPSDRLELAIERYRYRARLNPDSAIVQTNLGKLYHKNQQWQKAISCYQKAIAIDINYSPAHQYLAQVVNRNKQSSASEVNNQRNQLDFYFKLAQIKIQEGRLQEAQICYQQVIKSEPVNWQAYYRMGNLLAHHQQWEKALDSYQKVIQFKDNFSWAYNNAGNVCLALKRWQPAKDYYKIAIKLNPHFSWSYCNLGEAASQMKQWDQALSAYHQAQQLQPEIRGINEKIKNANHQLTVKS